MHDPTMNTTRLRFSLNTWQHLFSLHQAALKAENQSGNQLIITGIIRNEALFEHQDMPISVVFKASGSPQYKRTADNQIVLGPLLRSDALNAEISIDSQVFNELKKNLVEYSGIEGIHIVMTIGLQLPGGNWREESSAQIIELDYAMKGDG